MSLEVTDKPPRSTPAKFSGLFPSVQQLPQVVRSTAGETKSPPGYAFRGRKYAEIKVVPGSPKNDSFSVCLDTGCGMSLIDRNFLLEMCPTIEIQTMETEMKVRGLGSQRHDASQFVILDFYLPATNGIIAMFSREIHIVDELETRVLLGMDIIHPEGWIIDFDTQLLTLPKCAGVQVKFLILTKDAEIKIAIYARKKVLIPHQSQAFVVVNGREGNKLPLPIHDMMFEPVRQNNSTTFAHLVSGEIKAIMVENPTDKEVIVPHNLKLGNIVDSDAQIMTAVQDIDICHLAETPASTPFPERRLLTKGLLAAATATSLQTAIGV